MSEEFDDIMRQKFAEKEFIFNEANWEKAEIKIDAAIRLQKIIWWGSVFSIGLVAGVLLMLFIKSNKTNENANINNTKTNSTNTISENQNNLHTLSTKNTENTIAYESSNSTNNETGSSVSTKQINENGSVNEQEEGEGASISAAHKKMNDRNNSNTLLASVNADKKRKSDVTGRTGDVTGRKSDQLETSRTEKNKLGVTERDRIKNKKEGLLLSATKGDNQKNVAETVGAITAKKKAKKLTLSSTASASKKEDKAEALSTATTKNEVVKNAAISAAKSGAKKSKTATTEKNAIAKKSGTTKENKLVNSKIATTDSTSSTEIQDSATTLENKLKLQLQPVSDSLNDSLKTLAIADSLKKQTDSMPSAAKPSEPAPLGLDGLASINLFTIDAGVNGQLGWDNGDNTKEGRAISPTIGVGIIHYFNQKWSVNACINYSTISHLKTSSVALTYTYSFGVYTSSTTLSPPRTLHYIGIPLFLQYHLNTKNAVFVGGNVSYLINNKMHVEGSGPSANSTVPTTVNTGFYNPFDASLSMGYRRRLGSHFSITPIAYFGLIDIKKNAPFHADQFERNSGFKLILSYTIFDF